MAEIGMITEQGDLGFGYDVLNNKDKKVYEESVKRQQNNNDSSQVINEKNK